MLDLRSNFNRDLEDSILNLNLKTYLENRARLAEQGEVHRKLCTQCFQSVATCYCGEIRPFDPRFRFVILIHPHEARRRIATGRMSHLSLKSSTLITGENFTDDKMVNRILRNPQFHSVILYPGRESMNLSPMTTEQRAGLFPQGKDPVIFVIDGTWRTAKKMLRLSENLRRLPQVCFTPPRLSRFRIRKQPAPECFSTIEAIHELIELVGPLAGFDLESRKHDALLDVFDSMVERQLTFVQKRETASL